MQFVVQPESVEWAPLRVDCSKWWLVGEIKQTHRMSSEVDLETKLEKSAADKEVKI